MFSFLLEKSIMDGVYVIFILVEHHLSFIFYFYILEELYLMVHTFIIQIFGFQEFFFLKDRRLVFVWLRKMKFGMSLPGGSLKVENILEDTDEISLELKVNKQEIEHVNRQNGNCSKEIQESREMSEVVFMLPNKIFYQLLF